MPRRVLISVAEASADLHASHLARRLFALDPTIEIHACGGPLLQSAGAQILHETVSRAAMGFAAVGRAAEMRRMLKSLRTYFDTTPPDLLVCCDSWAINHHIATLAHERSIPVLYYIAPQTWASREGRIKKMRHLIDYSGVHPSFRGVSTFSASRGITATFVGHPLFATNCPTPRPGPRVDLRRLISPDHRPAMCGSCRSIAASEHAA